MMGLGLSLGVTGFLMVTGLKEQLEDFHEVLANTFIYDCRGYPRHRNYPPYDSTQRLDWIKHGNGEQAATF